MNNDKRLEIIFNHIKNGVEFISTDNVFIDETVRIGKHTRVFPDQYIRGNTVIGNSCVLDTGNVIEDSIVGNGVTIIKSVLRNAKIGDKTTVGPFANVHTNADVGKECRVGNFVEIKNATVGQRVKAAHLAYVGDVDIGDLCNVGCGSIFVNYDGKNKHRSTVGESVLSAVTATSSRLSILKTTLISRRARPSPSTFRKTVCASVEAAKPSRKTARSTSKTSLT